MSLREWIQARGTELAFGLGILGIGVSTPLHGQTTTSTTAAPIPTADSLTRVQIHVDSTTSTVGFAVFIPGGSSADPAGQEGSATLLAATLNELLAAQTRSIAADAQLSVGRGGVTVVGRAAPDALTPVVGAIGRTLFEDPVPLLRLEQARADLLSRLRFESGAPVRAFEAAVSEFVFRAFDGWSHPESGSLTSVEAINLPELAAGPAFGASARDLATLAVVGPVDTEAVRKLGRELLGSAERTPTDGIPAHAWTTAETSEVDAEITSTWVAVALPLLASTPSWRIELLAHHIEEVLRPDPPRPGLISPKVAILRPEGLPVILVTFAISPERAATWVDRVLATARLETDAPPDERFFRWQRRRFRTVWLSDRARPERRAEHLAQGWAGNTPDAIEAPFDIGVWRTDLEDVARALGEPRVVIYGPAQNPPEAPESVGLDGSPALDPFPSIR